MDDRKAWLQSLKVGDEVWVRKIRSGCTDTVTQATGKYVHVGITRFRRSDGHESGPQSLYKWTIYQVTDALRLEESRATLKDQLETLAKFVEELNREEVLSLLDDLSSNRVLKMKAGQ